MRGGKLHQEDEEADEEEEDGDGNGDAFLPVPLCLGCPTGVQCLSRSGPILTRVCLTVVCIKGWVVGPKRPEPEKQFRLRFVSCARARRRCARATMRLHSWDQVVQQVGPPRDGPPWLSRGCLEVVPRLSCGFSCSCPAGCFVVAPCAAVGNGTPSANRTLNPKAN